MKEKVDKDKNNENKFLLLVAYFISIIFSIFRSIWLLFWKRDSKQTKKWIFFESLDFIWRKWPKYFWKNPNTFKLFSILWDFLNFIFYNNKK